MILVIITSISITLIIVTPVIVTSIITIPVIAASTLEIPVITTGTFEISMITHFDDYTIPNCDARKYANPNITGSSGVFSIRDPG